MSTTGAYVILFSAILVTGISIGYHASETIGQIAEGIRNINLKDLKKYWINRKLNKQGIIKRVYCVMDSLSESDPCELVSEGKIYNVIREHTNDTWHIAGCNQLYVLKETNDWFHHKTIFVDYDEPKLEERVKAQRKIVDEAITQYKKLKRQNFKFLKK